ncbi:MAG TPA: thioredoxin family protein [Burkholderiaceae bacterium]|nr:thioredoxin family protein [Burkholderiaceae bacterium]
MLALWRWQPGGHAAYSPTANPSVLLEAALTQARASNKKVLVIAGGDWCRWCLILERFVAANPDVKSALDGSFVVVKVYVGEKNRNTAFFAKLPKAQGYPHFWVLNPDGNVAASVNTGPLEKGPDSYDKERFLQFIRDMRGA